MKRRRIHLAVFSVLAVPSTAATGLFGCGEESNPCASPIEGTQVDTIHTAVGAVVSPGSLCTGTLVGERTVLTAAHCVASVNPSEVWFVTDVMLTPNANDWTRYDVESVAIAPGFFEPNSIQARHDIAVLTLAAPPPLEPMTINMNSPNFGSCIELVTASPSKGKECAGTPTTAWNSWATSTSRSSRVKKAKRSRPPAIRADRRS